MASFALDDPPGRHMNDGLFKVHFQDPQSVREPRSIPGSQKLVVIACGHHSPPEGAVAIVDPSLGVNNPLGLNYITPNCSPLEGGLGTSPAVAEGGVPDRGGLYRTPWPLSEKGFLVSYAYHNPTHTSYAAYYIDVWGNKELIHRDAVMDVMCPMPIRQRPIPPILPSQVDEQWNFAVCYLDDVNRDMPGVDQVRCATSAFRNRCSGISTSTTIPVRYVGRPAPNTHETSAIGPGHRPESSARFPWSRMDRPISRCPQAWPFPSRRWTNS